ncbi:MAG: FliH/SctL family protein [Candidatus Brocadiales bacterium]
MKRIYTSPTIDGIYILNYTNDYARSKKNGLNTTPIDNPSKVDNSIEAARKEGYQQGLKDAMKDIEASKEETYHEGMKDGCKQAEDKLSAVFRVLQDAALQIQREKCDIWQKSETEIIKLALAIAQRVVGYEVANNNHLIEKAVAAAIEQVGKRKIISIRVNPADVTKLKDAKITTDSDNTFEIVADQKIGPGGCMVETDFGCIDAQLETRMNKVINELSVES